MSQEIKIPAQPVTPERLERIKAIPGELMSAAVALVCSSERYDLNRDLNFAQLGAGQAIIDLVAEVEGLTASRNYGRDIINDMTLEADDFRQQVAAQLAGLLSSVPEGDEESSFDEGMALAYDKTNERIRAAASRLGLELPT